MRHKPFWAFILCMLLCSGCSANSDDSANYLPECVTLEMFDPVIIEFLDREPQWERVPSDSLLVYQWQISEGYALHTITVKETIQGCIYYSESRSEMQSGYGYEELAGQLMMLASIPVSTATDTGAKWLQRKLLNCVTEGFKVNDYEVTKTMKDGTVWDFYCSTKLDLSMDEIYQLSVDASSNVVGAP